MDEAELRAYKMTHNALNQRATAVLAMAEIVQDYRSLAAQLLAKLELLDRRINDLEHKEPGSDQ